jgi:benzoyl-CoA-dihydrodiol lyase
MHISTIEPTDTEPQRHIDFRTSPAAYRHWDLTFDGPIARLTMNVAEDCSFWGGYELKLNSYDIGVDIELCDAVQRLRFEHPEVHAVILGSAAATMFCAGANIRMLAGASHVHKVNFCKFTNETRNSIEDASAYSGQRYLAAVNGTAAGGGYELALATDRILLIDDGNSAVSLPEVPLLGVLPGTGGLTRVTDKRKVRRDLADVFCTVEEGIKGQRALDWRLVDELVPSSKFADRVAKHASNMASTSDRPSIGRSIELTPLERKATADEMQYPHLTLQFNRATRSVVFTIFGPGTPPPTDVNAMEALGADFWPLALMRALDDAILHCRFNEPSLGTWVLRSEGSAETLLDFDEFLNANSQHWLVREILLYIKRTLKRLDVSSRTLIALAEPGSCFAGLLAELLFAADQTYMLDGRREGEATDAAAITLTDSNFGTFPMPNDLSRLETRFWGDPDALQVARQAIGDPLGAAAALTAGLVTATPDDLDWEDEIRILIEQRASFSPDALSAMESNLRFPGPETMETKIFGRLSAWQNWVFQRPNAVGPKGTLSSYGTGKRPDFDRKRV